MARRPAARSKGRLRSAAGHTRSGDTTDTSRSSLTATSRRGRWICSSSLSGSWPRVGCLPTPRWVRWITESSSCRRTTPRPCSPSATSRCARADRRPRGASECPTSPRGKSAQPCTTDSLMIVSVRDTDWDGVRLHVVTGKGGTGKTTVAAALALALASNGRPVLLMEVEGRQGIAQLFDVPPLPYEERKVAVAPADDGRPGGDVYALAVDPQSALIEYLEMFYNMRQAGRALTKLGVLDFATTIAPGLSDVLLTGKAAEATRRRSGGNRVYGAVVMDAPPTGRISRFLNVSSEVSGLARVGPIRGHADTVRSVIASPQTVVHFV